MRRFLASELPTEGHLVTLSIEQSHHLLRVVGIAPNECVILLDGNGNACEAQLDSVDRGLAILRFVSHFQIRDDRPELWMALALTKPPAFALALRMLTEIGVDHIVPVMTERSQRRNEKSERWQRIMLSALQQSGRGQLPQLYPLQTLNDMMRLCEECSNRFFLHPRMTAMAGPFGGGVALIGPEGGLSESEVHMLTESGWLGRSLGLSTLRSETAAAVTAGLLLQPTS